ncbi:RNA 3'-terminal phosphate cyclase [Galendromus occidentalis]|uniref:RNA 3'-terminal phosphate cyclase n=1 Tax=Galendromus occidentalis TaxID=34638 RepID=A0AAJ6QW98_9ACAR|nr:RNA 3'-terminal phosphate cyclase [Galendromus occidentalis]
MRSVPPPVIISRGRLFNGLRNEVVCALSLLPRGFRHEQRTSQDARTPVGTMTETKKEKPIEIDGSVLEGGGQVLRIAVSLSAILGKPVNVYNIRKKRSREGLKNQHMKGLELVTKISNGTIDGCQVNSREITLYPGRTTGGRLLEADSESAGSIALMLQVALPVLIFAPETQPTKLILRGGTNCDLAPQIDYCELVLRPWLKHFGVNFDIEIKRRGYFPKGGGEVEAVIHPITSPLRAVDRTRPGEIVSMTGYSFAAGGLPLNVAQVMASGASATLKQDYPCEVNIRRVKEPAEICVGSAAGIILAVEFSEGCVLGADALLQKNSRAERLGVNCVRDLIKVMDRGVTVDDYMQDQLIIFMALARGKSRIRCHKLSEHAETAIYICEKMTSAKFRISERDSGTTIIECEGIGWAPPTLDGTPGHSTVEQEIVGDTVEAHHG